MSSTAARSTVSRMIERHAVRDARAAVVAEHAEALEAEVPHDLDLIERHRAFRVQRCARRLPCDLAAVAVAAQIRDDDGVVARELARDGGPRDAALRRAVQEQDGRPAAADHAWITAPDVCTFSVRKPGKNCASTASACCSVCAAAGACAASATPPATSAAAPRSRSRRCRVLADRCAGVSARSLVAHGPHLPLLPLPS